MSLVKMLCQRINFCACGRNLPKVINIVATLNKFAFLKDVILSLQLGFLALVEQFAGRLWRRPLTLHFFLLLEFGRGRLRIVRVLVADGGLSWIGFLFFNDFIKVPIIEILEALDSCRNRFLLL